MAIELSDKLFDISDSLEQKKELNILLEQLDILCRKITNFQK